MYQRQPYATAHSAQSSIPGTPMRDGSLEDDPITSGHQENPFATPFESRPESREGFHVPERNWFHSRRVKKGTVDRPWMDKKDPKEKWVTIIPLLGLLVGLGLSGFLIWDGLRSVVNHTYCSVLDEDFSAGFNTKVWTKEAEVGGFGYEFLTF
jgi:hypothetical protein